MRILSLNRSYKKIFFCKWQFKPNCSVLQSALMHTIKTNETFSAVEIVENQEDLTLLAEAYVNTFYRQPGSSRSYYSDCKKNIQKIGGNHFHGVGAYDK